MNFNDSDAIDLLRYLRDKFRPMDGSILIICPNDCIDIDIRQVISDLRNENKACKIASMEEENTRNQILYEDIQFDMIVGILCNEDSHQNKQLDYGILAGKYKSELEGKLCYIHNPRVDRKKLRLLPHWVIRPYYGSFSLKKA